MKRFDYQVKFRERAYQGFLTVDLYDASVEDQGRTVEMVREVQDHGNGATVLPYDAARKTALLVRQLRVPVHVVEGDGLILEAAAGVLDPGDATPADGARREAGEELGYRIHNIEHVTTAYTIPGLVTEQMHFFLATYTPDDKIIGDTNADDDEVLIVEEWPLAALWQAFADGRLTDVKAIVLLQALKLRAPELFE